MIASLHQTGVTTAIVDARTPGAVQPVSRALIAACYTFLSGLEILFVSLRRIGAFYRFWRQARISQYRYRLFVHCVSETKSTLIAIYRGHVRRLELPEMPGVVVANDLLAGIFARAFLGPLARDRLYYDAHEFSPFRNRERNSIARAVINLMTESWVATGAFRMGCVSTAICSVAAKIYAPAQVDYVPNAYYSESRRPSGRLDPTLPLHIVYFGAPSTGRGLRLLGEMASSDPALTVTLFVPGFLDFHETLEDLTQRSNVHIYRGQDYEPELLALMDKPATVLSWCVIEDICLSYRLAEPSKYHQSKMFGIPVIVAEGQHLASLIQNAGNGVILSSGGLRSPETVCHSIQSALEKDGAGIAGATLLAWENSMRFPGWKWPEARRDT